jgi:hypothetical protein
MSRPLRPDDLAIITVNDTEYPSVISFITPDHIIAGDYTLIPTTNGWQVRNYTAPHTVRFEPYREQLLSGTEDVDRLILLELDYQSLLRACSTDQYTNKICQDDFFWRQKVERDMGHKVMMSKLPGMSYREQYRTLTDDMDEYVAMRYGRLDYLIFNKIKLGWSHAQIAAEYGLLNILKYAIHNGVSPGNSIANAAAKGGHINILEWLHDFHDVLFDSDTADAAAEGGRINVLEWLYERRILPNDNAFAYAVDGRHEDVIEWLLDHGITPVDPENIANNAAFNDDVDMLNFLETKGILPNYYGFIGAAESGHKDVVEWLINNDIAYVNTVETANLLAAHGSIYILELLASRGILPDEEAYDEIVKPKHRKIVRWLAKKKIYPRADD